MVGDRDETRLLDSDSKEPLKEMEPLKPCPRKVFTPLCVVRRVISRVVSVSYTQGADI